LKKPGIVGGLGPESTVDYYKMLIELSTKRHGKFPEIIVYSIDMNRMLTYVAHGDFKKFCAYLLDAVEALVVPGAEEIEYIHEKIMNELEKGIVKEETKAQFLRIIEEMKNTSGVQGVILGCTELPLMFPGDALGIPFLNTSRIHVESAYQYMVRGGK